MKRSSLVVLAIFGGACFVRAADATTAVDYTDRNTPFAATGSVTPQKQSPVTNTSVQEKRVPITTVDKQTSGLADRRAAIDLKETHEKQVREKDSHRPQTVEQPTSAFNHRTAAITTSGDTTKPPIVAKYQDGLTAASAEARDSQAWARARASALDRATSAKINRFVFRKNPSEGSAGISGSPVTPAAGRPTIEK
jgi:hypothetical protein